MDETNILTFMDLAGGVAIGEWHIWGGGVDPARSHFPGVSSYLVTGRAMVGVSQ